MTRHADVPRQNMAVRLGVEVLNELDALAEDADVNRSEMIRRLLAAACADPKLVRQVTRQD